MAAQVLVKLGADLSRVRQQVIQVLSGSARLARRQVRGRGWCRMTMPADLLGLEEELAQVRRKKEAAIEAEDFEGVAALRDAEQQLLSEAGASGAGMDGRGWTLRRSSRRTSNSTARSSACGSCCAGTGSSQTAGPPQTA